MKILGFVSTNLSAEANHSANAKRVINFYKELSKYHTIDILSIVPLRCNRDTLRINNNLTIYKLSLPHTTVCHYLQKFKLLPLVFVAKLHEFSSIFCSRYLNNDYDVYQIDSLLLYGLVRKRLIRQKIVYASHNVELDWYDPMIRECWFSNAATAFLKNLEGELCRRATLITTISEQDRDRFSKIYTIDKSKICHIPMGYEPESHQSSSVTVEEIKGNHGIPLSSKVVLFCGSDFYGNRDALLSITKDIAPHLENRVTVVLVGTIGQYYRKIYPLGHRNIIALGFVENIREIYSISDLAINPVLSGSGANVKLIDYLASNLEVVTTPFGMRGYDDLSDQVHLCEIEKMAAKINWCLKGHEKKNNSVKISQYQWPQIVDKASRVYEKVLLKPAYKNRKN